MILKKKTLLALTILLTLVMFGHDVYCYMQYGLDPNKHAFFVQGLVSLFFVWCVSKMPEAPEEINEADLPEGVTPIGRYLKEAAAVDAEVAKESPLVVPDGYVVTRDGKYVVPAHVQSRVDSDGIG